MSIERLHAAIDGGTITVEAGSNPTPDVFGTSRRVTVQLSFGTYEGADPGADEIVRHVGDLAKGEVQRLLGTTAAVTTTIEPTTAGEAPKTRAPRKAAEPKVEEAPKVAETPKVEDPDAWEEETPPDEAPAVVEITDADLNSACAKTNQRLGGQDKGGPAKIKALVAVYSPAGVQPKAGVIPADKRQEFLDALAELA